jgi:hypothetical protein
MKTKAKAGSLSANHHQTLVRDQNQATADTRPRTQRQPLKVKTQLKAGAITTNHRRLRNKRLWSRHREKLAARLWQHRIPVRL